MSSKWTTSVERIEMIVLGTESIDDLTKAIKEIEKARDDHYGSNARTPLEWEITPGGGVVFWFETTKQSVGGWV